jgi:hypothetical protein
VSAYEFEVGVLLGELEDALATGETPEEAATYEGMRLGTFAVNIFCEY